MARKQTPEEEAAVLAKLRLVYEKHLDDEMGLLHNRFVAFISESRLPLPQVLLVLEMLVAETKYQAMKKYLGK
jgi:hypothetical protein